MDQITTAHDVPNENLDAISSHSVYTDYSKIYAIDLHFLLL